MVTVAVQNLSLLSHLTIVSLWHNRCTGSPKTHWGDQRFMHATMARSSSSSFQSHISQQGNFFSTPSFLLISVLLRKCNTQMSHGSLLGEKIPKFTTLILQSGYCSNVLFASGYSLFSILKIKLWKNQFGLDQIIGSFGAN